MINKEQYERDCGNIKDMDEESFSRMFHLMLYERMRRDYGDKINEPRYFSASATYRCQGGHGGLTLAEYQTDFNSSPW